MQRWLGVFLLIVTFAVTTCAEGHDPCHCLLGGRFEVWGEALYLRPSLCDLDYAIQDERLPKDILDVGLENALPFGKQLSIRHKYRWTGRGGVGYILPCCIDIRLQYTQLESHRSNHHALLTFWPTFGSPGTPGVLNHPFFNGNPEIFIGPVSQSQSFLHAKDQLKYHAIQLEVGRRWNTRCLWYRTYAAIQYVHIEDCFAAEYQGTALPLMEPLDIINLNARVRDTRKVWGVGPLLGLEGRYTSCLGLGIGGRFNVALLTGNSRGRFFQDQTQVIIPQEGNSETVTSELDVCYRNRCITFPQFNGRLGLHYRWCRPRCLHLVAEVGYELLSDINVLSRPTFNHTKSTQSCNCESYNAHGIYLNVTVQI